ncbi:alpha/beta hydrolase [Castellaniella sp. GW247-6E4]|uniref:alpha/beta fold hydrolase n=1 Tax=Castellaniella sp. GW247-6E4 TaxID=3140380 RepID=UPI00331463F5
MAGAPELPQATLERSHPIAYTEAGAGDIVLLIHGSLCDYRYWRWQIPQLSASYRVVAASLRGCWPRAGTHPDPGYRIATHVEDMIALTDALGDGRPVHVLGHSRGAQIALEFALRAPERCKTLTLADPGFRFTHEAPVEPFYLPAVDLLAQGETDAAAEQFIDTVNGAGTWRKMVGWFKQMVRDNAATLRSQVLEANRPEHLEDIGRIECPVLLLGGADSPARYAARQDQLQAVLPRARREVIRLAAHGMNLANPRAFNRACLAFLGDGA